jgi:hypothetical protein
MQVKGKEISITLKSIINRFIRLLQAFKRQANRVKGIIKGIKGTKGAIRVIRVKAKREESY